MLHKFQFYILKEVYDTSMLWSWIAWFILIMHAAQCQAGRVRTYLIPHVNTGLLKSGLLATRITASCRADFATQQAPYSSLCLLFQGKICSNWLSCPEILLLGEESHEVVTHCGYVQSQWPEVATTSIKSSGHFLIHISSDHVTHPLDQGIFESQWEHY